MSTQVNGSSQHESLPRVAGRVVRVPVRQTCSRRRCRSRGRGRSRPSRGRECGGRLRARATSSVTSTEMRRVGLFFTILLLIAFTFVLTLIVLVSHRLSTSLAGHLSVLDEGVVGRVAEVVRSTAVSTPVTGSNLDEGVVGRSSLRNPRT